MKAFDTLLKVLMGLAILLFAISVWETQPMYAVNNSPPYGPPAGGLLLGGLMVLWLIFPNWLKCALLFAMASIVALFVIILDALGGLIPKRVVRG